MKHILTLFLSLFVVSIATAQTDSLQTAVVPQDSTALNQNLPKIYNIGDYYNDGVKEGVVFQVSKDGLHGKIINLKQSHSEVDWTSDETEQRRFVGATNPNDGRENMRIIQSIEGWKEKYPAFAWCAELGEDWYLPAIEELKILTLNDTVHDAVNKTLAEHNGIKLFSKKDMGWYWSSTEAEACEDGIFCAQMVRMYLCGVFNDSKKNINFVCAIAIF